MRETVLIIVIIAIAALFVITTIVRGLRRRNGPRCPGCSGGCGGHGHGHGAGHPDACCSDDPQRPADP